MADYYPLLARAVAGLPNATPEQRRAIYARATKALLGQLRAMRPAIGDEAIARESSALEDAVMRLEAGFAAPVAPGAAPAPPPPAAPAPSPAPVVAPAAPAPVVAPAAPAPVVAAAVIPAPVPAAPPTPPPPPAPVEIAAPAIEVKAPEALDVAPPVAAPSLAVLPAVDVATPGLGVPSRDVPETSAAPPLGAPRFELPRQTRAKPESAPAPKPDAPVEPAAPVAAVVAPKPRPGPRPVAPQPVEKRRGALRVGIVAVALGLVVAAVAVTAYLLRDRPEDLARFKPATPAVAEVVQPGKIVGRAGGAATASIVPANAPIAVSHRAAFLVEAPDEASKVKTYVGSVVWRLDNVSGAGRLMSAVRADVDIPDIMLKFTMVFQKNTEPALPASHTLELTFAPAPGSPIGAVKEINVPQMRREDTPTGDPLSGVPVTITQNHFLVGLSRSDVDVARNLDLVRSRGWFDVPMLLTTGRIAKITFEKGTSGDKVIADAMQSWQ